MQFGFFIPQDKNIKKKKKKVNLKVTKDTFHFCKIFADWAW